MLRIEDTCNGKRLRLFRLLVCVVLPLYSDCAPSFTSTPNNGNPMYQLQENNVTLSWFYNPDGKTVDNIEWSFNVNQRIATRVPSTGVISIHLAYTGRVEVSGNATIELFNIQAKDSGKYQCRVKFTDFDRIINDVELIVVVGPQFTLRTSGPITLDEGNTKTLLCVASGNPKPSITWYRDNVMVQEDPNNSNYTIASANKNHAGTYRCVAVVTAPGLSINPEEYTVAVTVRFKPQHRVDSLISNPAVVERRNAEFYCRLEAFPTGITYRWFKDGSQIFDSRDYSIDTIPDGERLTVKQAKKNSAGQYSCDGSNTLGTGERKSAYLLVNYAPQQVTVSPNVAEVSLTQTITLTCLADGFPKPSYAWKFNGRLNGVKQNTFTLTNADVNDAGSYTCVATNYYGSKEATRVINVKYAPRQVTVSPNVAEVSLTQNITLTCVADGFPKPSYAWKFNGRLNRVKQNTFTLRNAHVNDAGSYTCVATNDFGSKEAKKMVNVEYAPRQVTMTPNLAEVSLTQNITLTCVADGFPKPSYAWKFNGRWNGDMQNTFTLTNADINDAGNYTCVAANYFGSKERTIVVNVEYQPTVTTFTTGTPDNFVEQGTTVTLTCSANGYPAPTYTIKRGNTVVNSVQGKYVISNIQLSAEADMYSCLPQNNVGPGPTKQLQITVQGTSTVQAVVGTVISILVVITLSLAVYLLWMKAQGNRTGGRFEEQRRNETDSSEVVSEPTQTEFQYSTLQATEIGLVHLVDVSDEQIAAESERNGVADLDVPTEQSDPEELTPRTKEITQPCENYQTLDRETMDWETARDKVSIIKVIGEGAFGIVAKATVMNARGVQGERLVAVKMIKAHASESEKKDLLSELKIMKKLKPHPHVIKLLGCVTTSDPLMVLIEYTPYGDLLGFLRRSRGLHDEYYKDPDRIPETSLTPNQLLKFAFEIADGMSFLAFNNIIHRDLAARNVLVGDSESCKVTDFGMARETDYERKSGGRLPVKWTAYEALMYGHYTTKSDVWSYGVLLYEIFTIGGSPYPMINGREITSYLQQGKRMAKPRHLDGDLYQIMLNCWQENPEDRPTFELLKVTMETMKTTRKILFSWEKYDKHLYENVEISDIL